MKVEFTTENGEKAYAPPEESNAAKKMENLSGYD